MKEHDDEQLLEQPRDRGLSPDHYVWPDRFLISIAVGVIFMLVLENWK